MSKIFLFSFFLFNSLMAISVNNDNGSYKENFKDGSPKYEISYKNNLKHGKEIFWYESGQKKNGKSLYYWC